MKLLGLLRHAKSDWDDLTLRDFDRGLNKRGKKGAALMGAHIVAHGEQWDKIIASPAARVKATLAASELPQPITFADEAYLGDAATLLGLLREHGGDARAVLLAGHNPGLQELVLQLVPAEAENDQFGDLLEKFPTAAFAVLELDIADWRDARPGCGRLTHFARPRDLDPALGPVGVG
ncbi:histidine phosphatase family protein [Alteraurantiacibacter buctensis]|uniref:Histidine phosphatase family protein n=1 Tax=Alteraurantiacibacter buctensis TaxID=1503981 RepID=A0A844Z1J0_9SPHN|nr:histidine phosphatase family protein [Alteraurantiacibacter buctensis]